MKLTWSRGRRASRATSIASFSRLLSGREHHIEKLPRRSSVVRDDEAIKTLAETEDIWAKIRICRVAKTSEIRKQSFPGSSRCRRRTGCLLKTTDRITLIDPHTYTRVHESLQPNESDSRVLSSSFDRGWARVTHSPILFVYSLLQTTWNRGLPRRIPKQTAGRWRPQQKDRNYLGKSLAKRQSHAWTHNGKLMEGLPRNSL